VAVDQAKQGRGASEGAVDKAQEVAAQAKEQVQERADEVKGKALDRVREQLDTRSTDLGNQMASLAEALRKAAQHLEGDGRQSGAKVAHQAAGQVERLASYLTNSKSDRFLGDIERFGRERPWAAGAISAAAGFVGARFLKASSENRYATSYRARQDADLPLSRERAETTFSQPSRTPGSPVGVREDRSR
jgi:ElaB/YqjD/DUF883 family membrane-anchored ribosome-binding protein